MSDILADEMYDNAKRYVFATGLDPHETEPRVIHSHLHALYGFSQVQTDMAIGLMRREGAKA